MTGCIPPPFTLAPGPTGSSAPFDQRKAIDDVAEHVDHALAGVDIVDDLAGIEAQGLEGLLAVGANRRRITSSFMSSSRFFLGARTFSRSIASTMSLI